MNRVSIPTSVTPELCEEIGIHIGDGYLSARKWKSSIHRDYSVCLSLEEKMYQKHVKSLLRKLYSIEPRDEPRPERNGFNLNICSKQLVLWKQSIGFPTGPKHDIVIPDIVLKSDFAANCIRGIFDTDGSVTFKKKYRDRHYYPVIKIDSKSKLLILQISGLLETFGISNYTSLDDEILNSNGTKSIRNTLFISGNKMLEKWFSVIGSSNYVHLSKFLVWKKFGFCPPKTTQKQRKMFLDGGLNPLSFECWRGDLNSRSRHGSAIF